MPRCLPISSSTLLSVSSCIQRFNAVVGAICSSEEEAQQTGIPLTMLVVIPFVLMFQLFRIPDSDTQCTALTRSVFLANTYVHAYQCANAAFMGNSTEHLSDLRDCPARYTYQWEKSIELGF